MALTTFTDPLPELRKIRREIITYTRDDGAPLSATMYLPPDYADGTRLPLFIWAYPNEVSDTSTAGQVSGSEYRFTQIGGSSHLFLLLAGYAVMGQRVDARDRRSGDGERHVRDADRRQRAGRDR
jgi:dipeptidyl aminopeptidase/acylaminoacyl peptidase